jgi:NADH-quinone oxidoreductase subunit F
VSHFRADMRQRAEDLVALYPRARSAMLPLLHLAQEQDGYLTSDEGIAEVAELTNTTPADVRGTASFYDMFHFEPVGKYVVSICTNIACLLGGRRRVARARRVDTGCAVGGTSDDGLFTLEEAECLADCNIAPCVQVNHRYVRTDAESFDAWSQDLGGQARSRRARHTARWCACGAAWACVRPRRQEVTWPQERPRRVPRAFNARRQGGKIVATLDAPLIVTSRAEFCRLVHAGALPGHGWLRRAAQGAHHVPRGVAPRWTRPPARTRRRGLPGRSQVVDAAQEPVSYLVVNGDESEPATFKDHLLIERDPHQIIEGVLIAAYALQVSQAFIYMRGEFALGLERVQQALNEAYETARSAARSLTRSFSLDVVVHPGAGAYICGEETALIESLEGKRGFPRIKPPFFPP